MQSKVNVNIFDLERKMIPFEEWNKHIDRFPFEQQEWIRSHQKNPHLEGPMGIGFTPETGYYVLFCGQGPGVGWIEKDVKVCGNTYI